MVLNSNRAGAEDSGRTYQNVTLVGNWWEDRNIGGTPGLTSAERVVNKDFPAGHSEWRTTKQAAESSALMSTAPAVIQRPSMYNSANLADRLQVYGVPDVLAYTMGATQPRELATPPQRLLETTNKHFYEDRPAMQQAALLGTTYFSAPDRMHHRTGLMERDTKDDSRDPSDGTLGSKGARGEITRRPLEAGSAYGVSVFVDEYAKWPTKLAGASLSETVSKKKTQHF